MSIDRTAQERKSKLTLEAAEAVQKLLHDRAFWDALTEELNPVALSHISRRTWRGGRKPLPDQVVADAVHAISSGVWSWNPNDGYGRTIRKRYPTWTPEMCSLYHRCCRVIWSRVSEEYRKSKPFQSGVSDDAPAEEFPGEADAHTTTESWSDTPLDVLISEETWNALVEMLPDKSSAENELLRHLVKEIAFSYPEREPPKEGNRPRKPGWANRELAATLGVSESAIVNAKRCLMRIMEDWLWARFLEALPDDGRPWLAFVKFAERARLPADWKQDFAQKHCLSFEQVVEMGMELLELLHDWLKRTIRDGGGLQNRAIRIDQNILARE